MRNVFYVRQLDISVIIFWFSFNAMYLGENNGNLSETKKGFLSARFPTLSQNEKLFLDMRKDFLIMSNFYLVEILSEPNSLTILTSKKILKMSNYLLILSIFFLITRIRNLQCGSGKIGISFSNSKNVLDKFINRKFKKNFALIKFLHQFEKISFQKIL